MWFSPWRRILRGRSGDAKPSGLRAGTKFVEEDTGVEYTYDPVMKDWKKKTAPYSAIVCKDGSTVWAEDASGKTIASGEAGVDDASVIQSALDEIGSKGGGKIVIKRGNYRITETIFINYSNIELCGEGIDKTVLVSEIWEEGYLGAYSIIHSKDTEKLTGIFIHDLTIDSVYDYTTDITKVWATGIYLTNVDDSIIYRCKARNHFGSVFHVGAYERGAKQRHDDYLGTKAVMYCIAERCTGEIFSCSLSTRCALIGNFARDLVLQPSGQSPSRRWLNALNVEESHHVLVANNRIYDLPSTDLGTDADVAGVGIMGSSNLLIINNIIEASDVPDGGHQVHAIGGFLSATSAPRANISIIGNRVKNMMIRLWGGYGALKNINICNNFVLRAHIFLYNPSESGQDNTFNYVNISNNVIDTIDIDVAPISICASSDPDISRGKSIKISGNIINAPVGEEGWIRGIGVSNAEEVAILNNILRDSPAGGIFCSDCTFCVISNNQVYNPGRYASTDHALGIGTQNVDFALISGNLVDNSYHGGIRIIGSGKVIIKNNYVRNSRIADIFATDVATEYIGVYDNYIGTIRFDVTPTEYEIKRNIGYTTENAGTATFSGDGTTTDFEIGAHGLVTTDPSKIAVKITPVSSDAIAASPCVGYVDPADNTKIRVKFSSAPASGADNVKIVWYAEVIS